MNNQDIIEQKISIINAYLDCIAMLNSGSYETHSFYLETIYNKGSFEDSLSEFFSRQAAEHAESNHVPYEKLDFKWTPISDFKNELNSELNNWFFGEYFPIPNYYQLSKENIISTIIQLLESLAEDKFQLYRLDNTSFDTVYLDYAITCQDHYYYLHFSWND